MVGGPGVTFAPHAGAHGAVSPDHADPERSDAVLALENVSVRFGGISALTGVSLTVAEGAVWGLIGPNGAGKTTLFDVISGVRTPNEGRVWFRRHEHHERLGRRTGAAGPATDVPTGADLRVALGRGQRPGRVGVARRRGRDARRHRPLPDPSARANARVVQRVGEVLEQCGLTAVRADPVGSLPIGLARMVELARAIVDDPKLLLLDEPTSGLDETRSRAIGRAAPAPRSATTCAVILVEHDMGFVMEQCDTIAVLDLGRCSRSALRKTSKKTRWYAPRTSAMAPSTANTGTSTHKGDSREAQESLDLGRGDRDRGARRGNGGFRRCPSAESDDQRGDELDHQRRGTRQQAARSAAAVQGAQARFDRENAKGGVFGRKIKIVDTADDKFDPTTNVQETRRVVSSDNVFAIVPTVTVVLGAADYLAQQKVPFFGWGISLRLLRQRVRLRLHRLCRPEDARVRQHLHARGRCEGARQGPEGSDRGDHRRGHRRGTQRPRHPRRPRRESLGMKVVYSKGVVPAPPATVGDFTPFSQAIMTSNNGGPPDIVIMLFASIPSTLGLQGTLQAAGFKGPIENTQTYDPQLAAPSKGGSVYVQFGAFETASTVPGVKQMVADLKKADAPLGVLSAVGYLSADMFIAALKKTGKNLTIDAFQKAASKLQYNVQRTRPARRSFPKDRVQPGVCGTLVTSNGTGYDVTVPYFCGEAVKAKS